MSIMLSIADDEIDFGLVQMMDACARSRVQFLHRQLLLGLSQKKAVSWANTFPLKVWLQ